MKKLITLAMGALILFTVACDKKSDSTPAAPPANTFGYVNGTCYNTTTNTAAGAGDCANVLINGGYRWNGTICMDNNGASQPQNLCYINGVLPGTTGVNTNYRWNGVTCTDLNNQPVATTLCQSSINSQFQLINGNCIATMTGQWVSSTYCAGISGYNANQCNGWYIKYNGWGFYYTRYCQGNSCSGQTLTEYQTGRQVTCP